MRSLSLRIPISFFLIFDMGPPFEWSNPVVSHWRSVAIFRKKSGSLWMRTPGSLSCGWVGPYHANARGPIMRADSPMNPRRKFTHEFKRQVIEEVQSGMTTLAEALRKYEINSSGYYYWKSQYDRGLFNNKPPRRYLTQQN